MFRETAKKIWSTITGWIIFLAVVWGISVVVRYYQEKPVEIKPGSYLVINLDNGVLESPNDEKQQFFSKGDEATLRQVLKALEYAKGLQDLRGILLNGSLSNGVLGLSWAAADELRLAIRDCQLVGKDVVAYTTRMDEKDYFVLSTADKIYLNPQSDIEWNGIGAEIPFVRGLLNKIGVSVEVVRAGKYKSLGEIFTRENMSMEEREQLNRVVDVIWTKVKKEVSDQRTVLSVAELERIAREEGIFNAGRALQLKMVDGLAFLEDFKSKVAIKNADLIDLKAFQKNVVHAQKAAQSDGKLALVYCDSELMKDEPYEELVDGLRKIREDKDIKGVLFRVNSPGGAVVPSAVIADELEQINKLKPVIVSMGGMAASGAYWVASSGREIWANDLTITGSIGVIGVFPSVQRLASDWGVTFDRVSSGPLAMIGSPTGPMDENQREIVQRLVGESYRAFVTKVAAGRDMNLFEAEALSQGRVWMGGDAKEKRLVDNIGGLLEAELHLGRLAELKNAKVEIYPEADKWKFIKKYLQRRNGDLLGVYIGGVLPQIRASGFMWAISPMWMASFR